VVIRSAIGLLIGNAAFDGQIGTCYWLGRQGRRIGIDRRGFTSFASSFFSVAFAF
jgi:hypothetical protein